MSTIVNYFGSVVPDDVQGSVVEQMQIKIKKQESAKVEKNSKTQNFNVRLNFGGTIVSGLFDSEPSSDLFG